MDALVPIVLLSWFGLGAIIAAFIYLDMKGRKSVSTIWVVLGFLLNLIGLLIYYLSVRASRRHPYQYPPLPRYDGPMYDFDDPKEETVVEEKEEETPSIEHIEGIPRCPNCGAAISSHEWECPHCGAKLRY